MPRTLEIKNAFNTGEISPLLLGRTDLAKYVNACEELTNFYPRVQGGISRRPGLRYIQDLPAPGRLIPFSSDSSNSFILIFMDSIIRIYQVTTGTFIEILSPFKFADDFELIKYVRIGNIMYLVHPKYPVQKLVKISDSSWVLIQPNFYAAPATQQDQGVSQGIVDLMGFTVNPFLGTVAFITAETMVDYGTSHFGWPFEHDPGLGQSIVGSTITAGTGSATVIGVMGNSFPVDFGVARFNTYQGVFVTITASFDANEYPGFTITGPSLSSTAPITVYDPTLAGDTIINFSAPVLILGDVGKQIIAGTGIATILSLGGVTSIDTNTGALLFPEAIVKIIDPFDSGNYDAGNWFLRGGPGSYFSAGDMNPNPGPALWQGSSQFGIGSQIIVRSTTKHPTDGTFQESTGTSYQHVPYTGGFTDTFRLSDVGRYVSFSGGYGIILRVGTGGAAPVGGGSQATEVLIQILSPPTATETDAFGGLLIAPAFPGSWFFDDPAFTEANGFPDAVCFFQDRLWFAGTDNNPQTLWASQLDDFENFAKGTLDDDGIEVTIASGTVDKILWIQPYLGNIIAGTFSGEHVISGTSSATLGANSQAITPSNISATFQSAYGVSPIQPIIVQEVLFYIQRRASSLYQLEFDIQTAAFKSKNLSILSDLISSTPFIEMSYEQNPSRIVWIVVAPPADNKSLVALTYDREQDVFGWHRHKTTNGIFLSVTTVPNVINSVLDDQTYCLMDRRSLTGHYTLEVLDYDVQLDFSSHFLSNSPVDHIQTGVGFSIDYLNGLEVTVVADGALLPSKTLSGGRYDFPPGFTAIDIQIGINYVPRCLTARPEVRSGGTSQGILKRWNRIWIRVYQSLGLSVNGQPIPNRTTSDPMDQGVPLFTGDEDVTNLGWDRAGRVVIEQNQPFPCTVLAMFGSIPIGEN